MKNGAWAKWAAALKNNTYALYLASKDTRVPLLAKIIIGLVLAYALSPIDLIPDFIPVIGYLDDLLLLPLGIWIAIQLIPRDVWNECQASAVERVSDMPRNRLAAGIIILIWVLAIGGVLPRGEDLLLFCVFGALCAAQQWLLTISFRYAEASLLAPFEYMAMIFAAIVGYLFWGEIPVLTTWIA